MCEELVKRLRRYHDNRKSSTIFSEAADAIEELSRAQEQWIEQERKMLLKSIPRWIPVTERLPENCADVLAYIERNAWGDEDVPYRKREIAIAYHVNGMWHVDGCAGVDCIAWQPLPEPPEGPK